MWVGELEGRVKALAETVVGHDVVWVAPGLQEALYAGQHARSPQGLLDALLPAGRVRRDHDRGRDRRRAAARAASSPSGRGSPAHSISCASARSTRRHHRRRAAQAGARDARRRRPTTTTLVEASSSPAVPARHRLTGKPAPARRATAADVAEDGRSEFEARRAGHARRSSGLPLALLDPNGAARRSTRCGRSSRRACSRSRRRSRASSSGSR